MEDKSTEEYIREIEGEYTAESRSYTNIILFIFGTIMVLAPFFGAVMSTDNILVFLLYVNAFFLAIIAAFIMLKTRLPK